MPHVDPHAKLFEAHVAPRPDARVLASNVSDSTYLADLAKRAQSLTIVHRDFTTLQSHREALPRAIVSDSVFPAAEQEFDVALVQVPKGRGFSRALLFTVLRALKPDGVLFVAGPNDGGANTAQTDLETLVGYDIPTLATKARHRIFSAERPEALVAPADWDEPWTPRLQSFEVRGNKYDLYTQPGIFSHEHLDPGTALLLETILPSLADLPSNSRVLDAACGYGIIGTVAQREIPSSQVVFTDVDLLALSCVRKSVPHFPVIPADLTRSPQLPHSPFDLILCNPPFHREHAKDLSFMHAFAPHARKLLSPRGRFALVANSFLPYRKLLGVHFSSVETLVVNPQYQVLVCM